MKTKLQIVPALMAVAMLAAPVAAFARNDHDRHFDARTGPAHVERHFKAAPEVAVPVLRRDRFREERHDAWDRHFDNRYFARPVIPNDWNYGYNYAPVVSAAPVTGYPVEGSTCAEAQRVMNQYYRDRREGHTAAANALLRKDARIVERCRTTASLGGMPAIAGYGTQYGANPYGYGAASTVAPLIQQFIR
ncbi:MAG TPA: hypothetical protein VMU16_03465 [Candidatus Binataceae bacterium]|nr:hypothetical protein [Candidatus Binataceae bacterium]